MNQKQIQTIHEKISPIKRNPQYTLLELSPHYLKVSKLNEKLSLCGKFATKDFYCRKDPNHEHLIKRVHNPFHCEIHYCNRPECMVHRFARQKNTFDEIQRFEGLNSLWHFVISFERIPLHDFKKDFSSIRKRQQYIMNKFFEKIKKRGVKLQGVRVFDLEFNENMLVLPHYHFGCIPVGLKKAKEWMKIIQEVRKEIIKNMKIKTPFHFQSFSLKNKEGVLSYLSKRASGLYSWHKSSSVEYIPSEKGKLLRDVKNGKYFSLGDVLTSSEYVKDFYNRAHFVTIGGLPRPNRHGSILTDSIPKICPIHGELERSDLRIDIYFDDTQQKTPPPNKKEIKTYPETRIEIIKIKGKSI